jgi:hypothetical protein
VVKGALNVKSRPEGLTGNVPHFLVAIAVPKSVLKDGQCGPVQINSYDKTYGYNPLRTKPDYCFVVNDVNTKTIELGYDSSFYLQAGSLKAPIDKHKINIMFRPVLIATDENRNAPEFLVQYKGE